MRFRVPMFSRCSGAVLVFLSAAGLGTAGPGASGGPAVRAWIETSLQTSKGQIRQFAFDGDPATYYLSDGKLTSRDHFTLHLEKPVSLSSVWVGSGRPGGDFALDGALLEGTSDGERYQTIARFSGGEAKAKTERLEIRSLRVRVEKDLDHPLALREFRLESDPPVAFFKYPVEVTTDVAEAPELAEWLQKTARICERAYDMLCDELSSDGYKPRAEIKMSLKAGYTGVAETGGGQITGGVKYFKDHPDDVGAMIHETVHVIQHYRGGGPGWLVEGIADYVRFYRFEPGKVKPPRADRARYDGSYRTSAAFLAYLVEKYDAQIVRKLNQRLREGRYKEEAFLEFTGKPVSELDQEWRATLRK